MNTGHRYVLGKSHSESLTVNKFSWITDGGGGLVLLNPLFTPRSACRANCPLDHPVFAWGCRKPGPTDGGGGLSTPRSIKPAWKTQQTSNQPNLKRGRLQEPTSHQGA